MSVLRRGVVRSGEPVIDDAARLPTGPHGLFALTVIAAGLAAYHNSFSGQFIFDDFSCIPYNPHIRTLWPLWQTVSSPSEISVAGRPLVSLSLAVNYALGGLHVWGYHAFNLALHLLAALALFGIVRRTLRTQRLRDRYGREASWLALAVTLLWMVHPLLTESVDYIIQRTELFMGLFLLWTLYCVIRAAEAPHRGGWYAAALISSLLGMVSKEVMAVAPLLALLYDRTFISGSFREALRRRVGLYAGLALTWVVLATLLATTPRTTTAGFGLDITPWDYAMTQCGVLSHYLQLVFWPHPLVADYSDWPVAHTVADVWPAAVVVIVLLFATLWALRFRSALGFLGAWFFLILAPTSSVLPIVTEVAAERRMYLPLAAVVGLLVIAGWELVRRLVARASLRTLLAAGLVVPLVATLGGLTTRRNEDYRTEVGLMHDVIAKRPRNARAYYNLGIAVAEQGHPEEAAADFLEALRLKPTYAEAHHNLAVLLADQGKFDEAIAHFTEALRLKPDVAMTYNHLGVVLVKQGKFPEAIRRYIEALRLQPAYAEAHNNLGIVLAQGGQFDEAIAHFTEALRLNPDSAEAHSNLGSALAGQGKLDEAVVHYTQALRLQPDFAETHNSLGVTLAKQGKLREATAQFMEALRLKPDYTKAFNNWRQALARQGALKDTSQPEHIAPRRSLSPERKP